MKRPFGFMPPLGPPKTGPAQRILAQWRGLDTSGPEKARQQSGRALSDIMPKVLTQLGMDRRRAEAEIVRAWNHLIDPVITAHAQPAGINRGTLFVTIDHSIWLDEIVRYRRKEILQQLQHAFGRELIQRISFRVG